MTKKTPQESLATVASAGDFSGAEGTTPLHFVAPDWLVYSAGTSICFWRFQETTDDDPLEISSSKPTPKQHPVGTKLYLNPTVKTDSGTPHVISGIARLAANPIKKTVAFAERGAVPSIFLSSFETMETCTVLEGLCNLDVADLAFSRCGSRLFCCSRGRHSRVVIVSTNKKEVLPGGDITIPHRIESVSVCPTNRDLVALFTHSNVLLMRVTKSFETFVVKASSRALLPTDSSHSISSHCWTPEQKLIVATNQGAVCIVDPEASGEPSETGGIQAGGVEADGSGGLHSEDLAGGMKGALVHVCLSEDPVVGLTFSAEHLITAHLNLVPIQNAEGETHQLFSCNLIKYWDFNGESVPSQRYEGSIADAPSLDAASEGGGLLHGVGGADTDPVFQLRRVCQLLCAPESLLLGVPLAPADNANSPARRRTMGATSGRGGNSRGGAAAPSGGGESGNKCPALKGVALSPMGTELLLLSADGSVWSLCLVKRELGKDGEGGADGRDRVEEDEDEDSVRFTDVFCEFLGCSHRHFVVSGGFLGDSVRSLTADHGGFLRIWGFASSGQGEGLGTVPLCLSQLSLPPPLSSLCLSPDGKHLMAGSESGTIRWVDLSDPLNPSVIGELVALPNCEVAQICCIFSQGSGEGMEARPVHWAALLSDHTIFFFSTGPAPTKQRETGGSSDGDNKLMEEGEREVKTDLPGGSTGTDDFTMVVHGTVNIEGRLKGGETKAGGEIGSPEGGDGEEEFDLLASVTTNMVFVSGDPGGKGDGDLETAELVFGGTMGDPKGGNGMALNMLWSIKAPSAMYMSSRREVDEAESPLRWACLDTRITALSAVPPIARTSDTLMAAPIVAGLEDGRVVCMEVPSFKDLPAVFVPADVGHLACLRSHLQPVTSLCTITGETTGTPPSLLSACMGGDLMIGSLTANATVLSAVFPNLHDSFGGGIDSLAASEGGELLLTTSGSDGCVWRTLGSLKDQMQKEAEKVAESDYEMLAETSRRRAQSEWAEGLVARAAEIPEDPEKAKTIMQEVIRKRTPENRQAGSPDASVPEWAPLSSEKIVQMTEDPETLRQAEVQRKSLGLDVESLRKRLRQLVEANEGAPEMERLQRNEFSIDFEMTSAVEDDTKKRCEELRATTARDNLGRVLLRDRLVKEFWNSSVELGRVLRALSSSYAVARYPVPATTEAEKGELRKILMLRRMERMARNLEKTDPETAELFEGDKVLDHTQFASGEENYIVNWGLSGEHSSLTRVWKEAVQQLKTPISVGDSKDNEEDGGGAGKGATKKKEKEEEEDGKSKKDEGEEGAEPLTPQALLFESFQLLTNSRRRAQITILAARTAEHRAAFNAEFDRLAELKDQVADAIQERLKRMRQILKELKLEDDLPDLQHGEGEEPQKEVMQVQDEEVKVEKYLSQEERDRLEKERLEEEERIRKAKENDAGERALMQMMGGVLKTKKDLSPLEVELEREEWMETLTEEEMNETQKTAWTEYVKKAQELQEEKERYVKRLKGDLQRLRGEVTELMKTFDVRLRQLGNLRHLADCRIFRDELFSIRLSLCRLQALEDRKKISSLQAQLLNAEEAVRVAREASRGLQERVAQCERVLQEDQTKDREVQIQFRQALADAAPGLEQDINTTLVRLFKYRVSSEKDKEKEKDRLGRTGANATLRGARSGAFSSMHSLRTEATMFPFSPYGDEGVEDLPDSPFRAKDEPGAHDPVAAALGEDEEPIQADQEGLETLEPAVFSLMLSWRRKKIEGEARAAKALTLVEAVKQLHAHHQEDRHACELALDRARTELSDHLHYTAREKLEVEVLMQLRQGQVELQQAPVVTDYSDAIVINQEVINLRNDKILELGNQKLEILERIKDFRKKLAVLEWERRLLTLQASDLHEREKDVHMLRVTKELQQLLRDGDDTRQKEALETLQRKIEHVQKNAQKRIASMKEQVVSIDRQIKIRQRENSMLDTKLQELQSGVQQREHIKKLCGGMGTHESAAANENADSPRRSVSPNSPGRKSAASASGGNQQKTADSSKRFKSCRRRAALLATAKDQSEEIDALRQELERLRKKTFPSFVHLYEPRPVNPDTRLRGNWQ